MSTTTYNREGIDYGTTVTLTTVICYSCAMPFAMPEELRQRRLKDHEGFYCPNGHRQYYIGESEEEKLKKQLAQKEKIIADKQESINYWNEQYHNQLNSKRTLKGHHTRLKNKIQQGICPCCDKKFGDLAAHMESEHPDFQHSKEK